MLKLLTAIFLFWPSNYHKSLVQSESNHNKKGLVGFLFPKQPAAASSGKLELRPAQRGSGKNSKLMFHSGPMEDSAGGEGEEGKGDEEDGWEVGDAGKAFVVEPSYLTLDDWELEKRIEGIESAMASVLEDELYPQASKYRDLLSKLSMDAAASVLRLNTEFYSAFREKDLPKLKRIWLKDPNIMIIHPFEDPVVGYNAVGRYWRQLFERQQPKPKNKSGKKQTSSVWKEVSIRDLRVVVRGTVAWVVCTEDLGLPAHLRPAALPNQKKQGGQEMYATNVFLRRGGEWKLALRHVSPDTLEEVKTFATRVPGQAESKSRVVQTDGGTGPIQINFKDLLEEADADDASIEVQSMNNLEGMSLQDFLKDLGSQAVTSDDLTQLQQEEELNENNDNVVIRLTDEGITVEKLKPDPGIQKDEVFNLNDDETEELFKKKMEAPLDEEEDLELDQNFFNLFGKLGFKIPPLGMSQTWVPPLDALSANAGSENQEKSVSLDHNAGMVPDFNNGDGKSLMRQTIESLQRLKRENRVTVDVKRTLIADIIAHAPQQEASMVEMAYELLVLQSSYGWGDQKIVDEFASQCEIIAANLSKDSKQ